MELRLGYIRRTTKRGPRPGQLTRCQPGHRYASHSLKNNQDDIVETLGLAGPVDPGARAWPAARARQAPATAGCRAPARRQLAGTERDRAVRTGSVPRRSGRAPAQPAVHGHAEGSAFGHAQGARGGRAARPVGARGRPRARRPAAGTGGRHRGPGKAGAGRAAGPCEPGPARDCPAPARQQPGAGQAGFHLVDGGADFRAQPRDRARQPAGVTGPA